MRVAALAVVPRVIRALKRNHQAEARLPAPAEVEQPLEKPEPVVTSPAKLQKRRWTITRSVKTKSPWLCAWWSPAGTRGPPSHFGGSRSWAYLHRRSFPINWRDPAGLDRHLEYFTLFEQGITQDGDSIYFNWDLRLSTSNGEDSLGGASLIHTLYVPSAKGWVKVGTDRQETGPMKNREVRRLKFQIKPWACDGIPKAIAIKVITELDGGKKTYSRESEYTIELGLKYRAYRVQNDRTIPEIWQDSWRIDRNSRN